MGQRLGPSALDIGLSLSTMMALRAAKKTTRRPLRLNTHVHRIESATPSPPMNVKKRWPGSAGAFRKFWGHTIGLLYPGICPKLNEKCFPCLETDPTCHLRLILPDVRKGLLNPFAEPHCPTRQEALSCLALYQPYF